MNKLSTILGASALLLSACGGGSGGDADNSLPAFGGAGSGPVSVDQIMSLESQFGDFSSLANVVPNVANATYNGFIVADTSPDDIALGALTINADFANGVATGSATDFVSYDAATETPAFNENLSGSLTMSGGSISNGILASNIGGTLTGATSGTTTVTAQMDGSFADVNGQTAAIGIVTGTYTNTFASGAQPLDGIYVAY